MKLILELFLFSAIVFASCSDGKTEKIAFRDFGEPIPLTRSDKALKGLIAVDEFFVADSLVVIKNSRADSIFMVYDLENLDLLYSWGTKGRSSKEYILPRLIKTGDNNLIIADFSSKKMEWWDLSRQLLTGKSEIRSMDMPQSIAVTGDSLFIYDRTRPEELDMFKWNMAHQPVEIFDFEYLAKKYSNSGIYLGYLGANKEASRIIYAYQYINGFDLLDVDGNILKKVRRESGGVPRLSANAIDYLKSKTFCFGLRAYEKSFFLYYVGYDGDELMSERERTTYIEEYDWDGKPLRIYSLPTFVSGFDVISEDAFICQDDYSEDEPLVIFERGR
jgi:hypothetical protein